MEVLAHARQTILRGYGPDSSRKGGKKGKIAQIEQEKEARKGRASARQAIQGELIKLRVQHAKEKQDLRSQQALEVVAMRERHNTEKFMVQHAVYQVKDDDLPDRMTPYDPEVAPF